MRPVIKAFNHICRFYYEGFMNMSSWGRKVWVILIIKIFIIFAVVKLLFFPDFLHKKYNSDNERRAYVRDQILNIR